MTDQAAQDNTNAADTASSADTSSSVDSAATKLFDSMEGDKGAADDASKATDDDKSADATDKSGDKSDDKDSTDDKSGDDKSDDKSKDDDKKTDDDKAADEVSYDDLDYSAYPEGVELDAESSEAFKALGKEQNFSKETMQALINFDAKRSAQLTEALTQAQEAEVQKWAEATRTDKEIGGANLDESLATAAKAVDAFGKGTDLKTLFDSTGIGDHPDVIKVFARIGKAISEDVFLTGRESGEEKSPAQKLYGNTK